MKMSGAQLPRMFLNLRKTLYRNVHFARRGISRSCKRKERSQGRRAGPALQILRNPVALRTESRHEPQGFKTRNSGLPASFDPQNIKILPNVLDRSGGAQCWGGVVCGRFITPNPA